MLRSDGQGISSGFAEGVLSLAAEPQLAENSRQGSETKNRTFALGFAALKSQTTQWGSCQASGRTAAGPTVYLYDGANVLEEVDNSANVLARYTQSSGIDQPLAELRSGIASYYAQDGIGSVSSLSNGSGVLANTYTYDSFGKPTASTGTLTNPFQYTGRDYDTETGLHYYRSRYYDPAVGRFASEDPSGFKSGTNFYTYVMNSPVVRIDPSGLDWVYHQSTGLMNHADNQTGFTTEVCRGYAGNHFGLNNPLAQDIPGGSADSNAGPLPQGGYAIGPLQDNVTSNGTLLPDSMRLIPDPTNDMLDRSGFLIHGGNMKTRNSSQGCIVLPRDCRITIGSSNDKVLRVVP
jgi:RHS repeat-associated protein